MESNLKKLEPAEPLLLLLAEDDPDQSDMMREILEEEGYRVDAVFSGDVALKNLKAHPYNLVILDIRMPGLDGTTVLKRYKKEVEHSAPVVIVSAFATDSEQSQYREAGAAAAFAKPYDIVKLLSSLRELVRKK
jgi:DNA-binding response OmpR family regulator